MSFNLFLVKIKLLKKHIGNIEEFLRFNLFLVKIKQFEKCPTYDDRIKFQSISS